jgi:hypothetical protein
MTNTGKEAQHQSYIRSVFALREGEAVEKLQAIFCNKSSAY